MAISADFSISSALVPRVSHSFRLPFPPSKVSFGSPSTREGINLESVHNVFLDGKSTQRCTNQCHAIRGNKFFRAHGNHETEGLILDAIKMTFLERLGLAWKILFPPLALKKNSNANIAKQRLKMILFSDRCAVSDEAKRKIVDNIVGALSDFVEIDSQDKVQLNVSTDADLGTVYSVTVPVRRVKPKYQDYDQEYRGITSVDYKDKGDESGSVDVTFDFYIPDKKFE